MEVASTEVIEMQAITSKVVECSLKSWKSPEVEGIIHYSEEILLEKRDPHIDGSESIEPLQNLRIPFEVGTVVFNYEEKPLKKRSLLDGSDRTLCISSTEIFGQTNTS